MTHLCLKAVFVGQLLLAGAVGAAAAEPRLNILWLIGEDLGPEQGCYGHPEVSTPEIDRLASQAMRFTRAYTVTPVCSTSRSSFMTGMYAWSIGAHNHRSHRDDGYRLPDGVRVLTDYFRDAGFFTANIRHFADNAEDARFYKGTGKTDWNFAYDGKPFDSDRWDDLKSHQPFYAQINFSETHRGPAWNTAHEHIERTADPAKVLFPPYYPDHPVTRADWAQYLNTVMALDKKIGYVLRKLERDGLAESTLVVFMGDHGQAMVRGKQWPYESGLHIPLIIRWPAGIAAPDQYQPGTVSDQLVASIDLAATCLAAAGIKPPLLMQGRVFLGPAADPPRKYVFGGRDRGDETVDYIRTVRDDRFRYIRNFYPDRPFLQRNRYKERQYPVLNLMKQLHAQGELDPIQQVLMAPTRPAEELYDLENDPYEIHNLASQAEYQSQLERLRGVLDAFLVESNDQGRIPEDSSIHEYWETLMKRNYDE